MREVADMICGGVMLGALFGLVAIAAGVATFECWRSWRIWRASRNAAALSLLAFIAIIVGGNKPPAVMVTWDEYFTSRSAIVDTNDLRRIDFAWSVADGVPPIATATLSAIEVHSVNPDPSSNRLFQVATVPMTNCHMAVQMPTDATNYLYWMECSFIPDAPVVTNGVYHLACAGEPGELITNITYGTWMIDGLPEGMTIWANEEYTPLKFIGREEYGVPAWEMWIYNAATDKDYLCLAEGDMDAVGLTFLCFDLDRQLTDITGTVHEPDFRVTASREATTNIHPNTVWAPMGTTIYDNARRISPPENNGGNE